MTNRVCWSISETETHYPEHDPQGCYLKQWWPLVGPSTALLPLLRIASVLLPVWRREKDLRKQNNPQKNRKSLKIACPAQSQERKVNSLCST